MKYQSAICLTSVLFTGSVLSAQAIFSDDFNSTLDGAVWTTGGYASPQVGTDGGLLKVTLNGDWTHSHHAFAQTVQSDFDFFSTALNVDWDLGDSGVGQTLPYIPNASELWGDHTDYVKIGWGITSTTGDADLVGNTTGGLFLGITFAEELPEATQGLALVPQIMGEVISGLPSEVSYQINATEVAITLTGATFTSSGSDSAIITHGLNSADFAAFYLTAYMEEKVWTDQTIYMPADSISVSSAVPEPSTIGLLAGLVSIFGLLRRRQRR